MQYHRGSTLVVERSYSYDTLGRPTNRSTARQGSVKNDTFTHNDRSELTAATLGTDAYSYSYDNIGNRKTAQEAAEEATAYDANNLNQYTAIQTGEEAAFVPTFDADGNQTKVQTSTGIWNVVYNAENRPVTFTSEDGATVVECTYDYMGRRHTRKITVNGSVTNYLRYIYRGYLQIAAINAVSGVFQWFILWDPTQPVATRPLGIRKDGTWYTYGWDLTKNICEVFGSDGYIKTAYTYTPYGAVTANGNVTQPIQWSSEFFDTQLQMVYYNHRHYTPLDGSWLSRDYSEKQSTNLYSYVNNFPWRTDYLGLMSIFEKSVDLLVKTGNFIQETTSDIIDGFIDHVDESVAWGKAGTEYYEDKVYFGSSILGGATGIANFIGVIDMIEGAAGYEITLPTTENDHPKVTALSTNDRIIHGGIGTISAFLSITGTCGAVKSSYKAIINIPNTGRKYYYSQIFPTAERTGHALKDDIYHRCVSFVSARHWRKGKLTKHLQGDGKRTVIDMEVHGELFYSGEKMEGSFEAIFDAETKKIIHQFFRPIKK